MAYVVRNVLKKIFLKVEGFFLQFKRKKDVIFIVKHRIMLNYVMSMHEKLNNDNRIRLWVCFPFENLINKHEIGEIKKIQKIKTMSYKLARFLKWDLIIYPDHDPYFREDCPKFYTSHGLSSGKKTTGGHYLFGPRSRRSTNDKIIYDKIFVSSKFVQSKIKEIYPEFYSRTRIVGSMFVDKVSKLGKKNLNLYREMKLDPTRKTIMVVSTWGTYSLAENQGEVFIKKIPEITKKYNLIISIHLLNFVDKYAKRSNWKEQLNKIESKNVYLVPPGTEAFDIMGQADLLVTDSTSFGLHYPILERPVIYYDCPASELDEISLSKELMNVAYKVKNLSILENDIENAFNSHVQSKMKKLSEKISDYPGLAGERFTREIYATLNISELNNLQQSRSEMLESVALMT